MREGAACGPGAGTTFPNSRRRLAPRPAARPAPILSGRPPISPRLGAGGRPGRPVQRSPRRISAAAAPPGRPLPVRTPGAPGRSPSVYLLAAAALLRALSYARHVPSPLPAARALCGRRAPSTVQSPAVVPPPALLGRPRSIRPGLARPRLSRPVGSGPRSPPPPAPAAPRLWRPRPLVCMAGPAPAVRAPPALGARPRHSARAASGPGRHCVSRGRRARRRSEGAAGRVGASGASSQTRAEAPVLPPSYMPTSGHAAASRHRDRLHRPKCRRASRGVFAVPGYLSGSPGRLGTPEPALAVLPGAHSLRRDLPREGQCGLCS